MHVVVDTNGLYTTQAGVARYIRGLLRGLRRNATPNIDISELAWEVENFDYRQPERALKTLYREIVWSRAIAPGCIRKMRADVVHATGTPLYDPPNETRLVVTL